MKIPENIKRYITPGTPQCSIAFALIGAVLAVLLLTIGLWKTLFICAFAAVGAVLGGIGNKQEAVREAVNRHFPAKDEPIRDKALEHAEHSEAAEIAREVEQEIGLEPEKKTEDQE